MSATESLVELLKARTGQYAGEVPRAGGPDEGEVPAPSRCRLSVAHLPHENSATLSLRVESPEGDVVEHEQLLFKQGESGAISLFYVGTAGTALRHELRRESAENGAQKSYTFGFNDPSNKEVFRQEISVDFFEDGTLGYRKSSAGMFDEFGPKLDARLKKLLTDQL